MAGEDRKYRSIEAVQHIWNRGSDQQVPANLVWPRCPYVRLPDTKRIFYGELVSGHRSGGGQMKRSKDRLKVTKKSSGINLETLEADAQNRTRWRNIFNSGVATFEAERLAKL